MGSEVVEGRVYISEREGAGRFSSSRSLDSEIAEGARPSAGANGSLPVCFR